MSNTNTPSMGLAVDEYRRPASYREDVERDLVYAVQRVDELKAKLSILDNCFNKDSEAAINKLLGFVPTDTPPA